jgi:sulfate/thiosulfate transport system ATP-binding protein
MRPAIVVRNLGKTFGDFVAVEGCSFDVEEGKITALLGPSGSGKSTVLRMIAGLEDPTEGQILLGGEDQTHVSVQDRNVGFVFQHYALFRHMTVAQNIAFGLTVAKEPREKRVKRVEELLELVHLGPFGDRFPDQLSGGQRQRVALARALAPKPKVLLLDEPFGALDARVRQDLRRWIDELHRELGITSVLVTHDQEEALELAHKVVVMHEGKVEQIGTSGEIYNEPATPFVASFVGAANVIRGIVIGGRVQFGEQQLEGAEHLIDGDAAHAFVRPHDVLVSLEATEGISTPAKVEALSDLGWTSKVRLVLPDGQALTAQVPNEKLNGVREGQNVCVDLRNAKVFAPGGRVSPSDELAAV